MLHLQRTTSLEHFLKFWSHYLENWRTYEFVNRFGTASTVHMLEKHWTRTVQSSRVGCSRRVHRIVYVSVKKGNIMVNILLLKLSSLIFVTYISSCVSAYTIYVGWVLVATASELCQKYIYSWKRGWKDFLVYVLAMEFMLSFDKMQNTSPLMCTQFEIWGQSILKINQAFHTVRIVLYIRCSGPVVEDLKVNMLQSTTRS